MNCTKSAVRESVCIHSFTQEQKHFGALVTEAVGWKSPGFNLGQDYTFFESFIFLVKLI